MRSLALVLAALALAGCKKQIDTDKAETLIAAMVRGQGIDVKGAECPDDVAIEAGATFTCTATLKSGFEVEVEVTQKDDEGNVNARLTTDALIRSKVEAMAREVLERGDIEASEIRCPEDRRAESGDEFQCRVTLAGGGEITLYGRYRGDGKGDLEASDRLISAALIEKQVAEALAREGAAPSVECGQRFRELAADETFLCTGTMPTGESMTIEISGKEEPGGYGWKVLEVSNVP